MNTPQYVAVRVGDNYEIRRVDAEHRSNRTACLVGGAAMALIGLNRRSLTGLLLLAGGGGLAYYGCTGKNPLKKLQAKLRAAPQGSPSHQHDDAGPSQQEPENEVDEAMMESFPASDPPAYHSDHAMP